MSSYILGLHQGHDAAVAILQDGKPIFAIAEERLSRQKHDSRFPRKALDLAFSECGISFSDLAAIAVSPTVGTPDGAPPLLKDLLEQQGISGLDIHVIGHHLSHAASAYYPSGFESALVFTSDGRGGPAPGGMESYCLFKAEGQSLSTLWRQSDATFSFGGFYGAVASAALGNTHIDFESSLDDAGKGMGLAPYGKPGIIEIDGWTDNTIDSVLDEYGTIDPENGEFSSKNGALPYSHDLKHYRDQVYKPLLDCIHNLVTVDENDERLPHMAMYFAQRWFEHNLVKLASYWTEHTKIDSLCLAGGCALNSVANTKLAQLKQVNNLFIQPACGDSGVALGAALLTANRILDEPRCPAQTSDALGKSWSDAEIESQLLVAEAVYKRLADPVAEAAKLLSEGKIIGWYDGRDEYGPRALGQRSILADARSASVKDDLNSKIKFRESFRPFAPIAPAEVAAEWFEVDDSPAWAPLDFMLVVPEVRSEHAQQIAGATHIDGSGRLQQVDSEHQEKLHRLLNKFGELTDVPVLINTSFNLKGQPIVFSPQDAYECFIDSKIDALIIGAFLITDKPEDADIRFEAARRSEQLYRALSSEDSNQEIGDLLDGEWADRIGARPASAAAAGMALSKIGKHSEAIDIALAQIARDPADSNAAAILFHLLPSIRGENGTAYLENALLTSGGSFENINNIFQHHMQAGNTAAANQFMRTMLVIKPEIALSILLPRLPAQELLAGTPGACNAFVQYLWATPGTEGVSRSIRTAMQQSAIEDLLAIVDFLEYRYGKHIMETDLVSHFETQRNNGVTPNLELRNWLDNAFSMIVAE